MVIFNNLHFRGIKKPQNLMIDSVFLLTLIIIFCLIIDNSISTLSYIIFGENALAYRTWAFSIIIVFSVVTQILFLKALSKFDLKKVVINRAKFKIIQSVTYVTQYVLMTILIINLLEIVFARQYSTDLVLVCSWISILYASSLLVFLTVRLAFWLKNTLDYTVLAYGSAISIIVANMIFTFLYITGTVINYPAFITSDRNATVSFRGSPNIFSWGYSVTSVLAFISIWVSSVLLLRHYSKKVGRLKLWTVLGIALIFFLAQFQYDILNYFSEIMSAYPSFFDITYTIVLNSSTAVGGVLAGIALWSVARKVEQANVRKNLMLASYGTMLLLASTQAIGVISSRYPPSGVATLTFMPIASFSMLIGIYFSAVYISQDKKLRQEITNSSKVSEQLGFLKFMGKSEMESEIRKNVLQTIKKVSPTLEEEGGIQPNWEENIKDYVDMVLKEREKMKRN